jgi:hypothetical protein
LALFPCKKESEGSTLCSVSADAAYFLCCEVYALYVDRPSSLLLAIKDVLGEGDARLERDLAAEPG